MKPNRTTQLSIFRRLVDVQQGELFPAALMFFALSLIIGTFGMVKPVRTSLFLQEFGARNLPYVYLFTAVVTGMLVKFYFRLTDRFGIATISRLTNLALAGNLLAFWWLLSRFNWFWLSGVFFVWVNVYTIVTNTVFWSFADHCYNPRQARRLYGFIAAGGTVGGIAGGFAVSRLTEKMGTENLLVVCAALLSLSVALTHLVRRPGHDAGAEEYIRGPDAVAEASGREGGIGMGTVFRSRYTRHIALALGMALLVSVIVDFQFNAIVEKAYANKDARTAFLGSFFAWVSGLAFILQFFFTSTVLRSAGLGFTLILLPITMIGGLAGMAFFPVLASAVFLKLADGSVRYSIEQSTRDILYLPIPAKTMYKVRAVIDMFVQRLGKGIGSLLILVVVSTTAFHFRVLSLIALAFAALWLVVALRLKKEYIEQLRQFLRHSAAREEPKLLRRLDAGSARELLDVLEDGDEAKILYALELLEGSRGVDLRPALRRAIRHQSPAVRARSLHLLAEMSDASLVPQAQEMLREESAEVQSEAIHYICRGSREGAMERMQAYIGSPNLRVRGAALACLSNCGGIEGLAMAREALRRMIDEKGESGRDSRLEAARTLGHINPPSPLHRHLGELLKDKDRDVVIGALAASGRTGRRDLIPLIVDQLSPEETRLAAVEALKGYGPRIVGTLKDYLNDSDVEIHVRRNLPGVFVSMGNQEAAEALLASLPQADSGLQFEIIKALNKIRDKHPEVEFREETIVISLNGEIENAYRVLGKLHVNTVAKPSGETEETVFPSIEQLNREFRWGIERMFRLLGLIYRPADIYGAYRSLSSPSPEVRATAVELLDSLLKSDLKKTVLPLVDDDVPIWQKLKVGESLGVGK